MTEPPSRPIVMVVEDEPLLLLHAVDIIEQAGFDVVEAMSADQAVEILQRRPDIQVVFTDIDMPGSMDGLKLAHLIRDRWPPIEIIIVSGHRLVSAESLPDRCAFFSKPFDTDQVVATVRRLSAPAP